MRATLTNRRVCSCVESVISLAERPAARESALDRVPEADRVLPALPAEEDHAAVPERVKIDEALIEIAQHDAEVGEAREFSLHLLDERVEVRLRLRMLALIGAA